MFYHFLIASFKVDRNAVSLITPSVFQEHIFRLFVKDPAKKEIAYKAFHKFGNDYLNEVPKKGKETLKTSGRITNTQ
jgi:hypothetical protein